MYTIQDNYVEKVYAGVLGMVIGVRHGANIEQWPYERIKKAFGEITGYLHEFKNFAADDDLNGPIYFSRVLEDYNYTEDLTAEEVGLTWLNYAPDEHGFFWWGGYGTSSEHTAYKNLRSGIMAPESGSVEQNGLKIAEQIGGQIFADPWGLINPGNPQNAASYAEKAVSVAHDLNGKYGGMFIAACIAAAFEEKEIIDIIKAGLSVIPEDSDYTNIVNEMIRFHKERPDNWRDCFDYVYENYGYDKYPGVCHIIPNTAVIILSLLYGEGDFSKTINILNMCGWDTDSTLGNVGTLMGIYSGLDGIDMYWREPINDFVCGSSVLGALNILDIPSIATYMANYGYKINNQTPPKKWKNIFEVKSINCHFQLPGSTHAFRTKTNHSGTQGFIENSEEHSYEDHDKSLKVVFDYANGGFEYQTYLQTYYEPKDFEDNRYEPSFSPTVYPGQDVSCNVLIPEDGIEDVHARIYVKDSNSNEYHYSEKFELQPGDWKELTYRIPSLENACIREVGVAVVPTQEERRRHTSLPSLIFYLNSFIVSGNPSYSIDFKHEKLEVWSEVQEEVSQLTYLRGLWELENGYLTGSNHEDSPAEAYTGHTDWKDYTFTSTFRPTKGNNHHINFRVQGAIRSYAFGLSDGKVILYKNNNGYTELKSVPFNWNLDKYYEVSIKVENNKIYGYVNGEELLYFEDQDNPYLTGQIGFSNFNGSRTYFKNFTVENI